MSWATRGRRSAVGVGGPTAGREQLVTVEHDGCTLQVTCLGAGSPLIFLHGLGSDSTDARRGLGPMPGFRLALPDQRGHGGSTPIVDAARFSLEAMVEDVGAILRSLGWTNPIVGGGSMGAAVALGYALACPGVCRALVLVGPALGNEEHPATAMFNTIADRIDAIGLAGAAGEVRDSLIAGGVTPPNAEAAVAPWLRQSARSLAVGMRTVFRWRPFADFGELMQLGTPVSIVAVPDDDWHPLGFAERLHAMLPTSDLEVLPSAEAASQPGRIGAAIREGLFRLGVEGESS